MKAALAEAGMSVTGFPDGFEELAKAGRHDPDDAATQLALIYADGNQVGAFLSAAVHQARIPKAEIVPVIDRATLAALADAIGDRFAGWSRPAVLANLAGGDDLLVSVPAIDAWMFVRTLLGSFGEHVDQAARHWPEPVRKKVPSLAAGMVFHHRTAAFSDVLRMADDLLREAKAATCGSAPAVAFLDLTADGGGKPAGREPVSLAYLTEQADRLEAIAAIPNSRRETLLTLLRQGSAPEFIRRLTDLDNSPLWQVVAGPHPDAASTRAVLSAQPHKVGELRRVLDIARYWRTTPRAESPGSKESSAPEAVPA